MKNYFKRLIATACAVMCVMTAMAGCSDSDAKSTTTTTSQTTVQTDKAGEVIEEVKPQEVTEFCFNRTSGFYDDEFTLMMYHPNKDAKIYYTTDGSTPTSASSVYSSPITVASDTTIKAIAMKNGESSNVATAAYVIAIPRTVTVNVTEDYDGILNSLGR